MYEGWGPNHLLFSTIKQERDSMVTATVEELEKPLSRQRINQLRFPDEHRSRVAVRSAVKAGRLPHLSTLACSECGAQANHYHHHKGYDKANWLSVVPICQECHTRLERGKTVSMEDYKAFVRPPQQQRGRKLKYMLGGVCPNGHALTEENVYRIGKYVRCRACEKHKRARRHRYQTTSLNN